MSSTSQQGVKEILMVEPDVDLVVSLARFAERRGIALRPCPDVARAREVLQQLPVHGVVVSLDLKGAPAFLAEIRQQWPNILRIATGRVTAKTLRAAVDAEIAHMGLSKPIDLDEFARCCARVAPPRPRSMSQTFNL